MMTNLLLPSIILPTRINTVNNTLIDNIFTNDIHPELVSGNLSTGISDHLPSFLVIPKQNQNFLPKKHNIMKRDRRNFSKEDFVLDYLAINWDETLELDEENTNHTFNRFLNKINDLLDKHMPLKKISQKDFKKRFKPWITNEILFMIKRKNKIFKRYPSGHGKSDYGFYNGSNRLSEAFLKRFSRRLMKRLVTDRGTRSKTCGQVRCKYLA